CLDQRPFRGALGTAAWTATRSRFALARAGQLFRLRRNRTFDELEADIVRARRLVLDQHDADMAAALELAEEHLVGQRLLDVLLDHAGHRPRTHLLIVAVLDQPGL